MGYSQGNTGIQAAAVMGIAPLAIAEFFARSPVRRQAMEDELRSYLFASPDVALPGHGVFLVELLETKTADHRREKHVTHLHANFLKVGADSCYGQLSLFSMNPNNPAKEDWERSEKLCTELLVRGLCSSIMLRQGCETKGLFGKRVSPAIIAPPDFAKLAVLKRLGLLNVTNLEIVVDALDSSAAREKYCESKWRSLADDCNADSRFAQARINP